MICCFFDGNVWFDVHDPFFERRERFEKFSCYFSKAMYDSVVCVVCACDVLHYRIYASDNFVHVDKSLVYG